METRDWVEPFARAALLKVWSRPEYRIRWELPTIRMSALP